MKAHEIRKALENLRTVREKIDYLETLPERPDSHFLLYTLATLYLDADEPRKAEALLREDLGIVSDPCDRYESHALLTGLYMDQNREIPDAEIQEMVLRFREMTEEARREAAKTKKAGGTRAAEGQAGRERRKRYEIYLKDPYQLERMIGDYYYGRRDLEKAFAFYESYYRDLDKPVETFVPESARRYAGLLLKKGRTDEALFFTGYIITLKPYMFEDLFRFADLYYGLNDRISALLILLFVHALCEGYDSELAEKSRDLVRKLAAEPEIPRGGKAKELAEAYLAGDRGPKLLRFIEGLKKEGIRNFFFSYLEGTAAFAAGDYPTALTRFTEFNDAYPHLAESHYYQLVCMYTLDRALYAKSIVQAAEKTIELKPRSPIAATAKVYLGLTLGLSENESRKLLTPAESGAILEDFVRRGSPLKVLDRLVGSLTIGANPYQADLVRRMAKIAQRREELVSYLKNIYDLLNETGRKNVRSVLLGLGETV